MCQKDWQGLLLPGPNWNLAGFEPKRKWRCRWRHQQLKRYLSEWTYISLFGQLIVFVENEEQVSIQFLEEYLFLSNKFEILVLIELENILIISS
jgi:hypothetical protein